MECKIKKRNRLTKILARLSEFTGFYPEYAKMQTALRINKDTGEHIEHDSRIMIKAVSPLWPFSVRVYITNEYLEKTYTYAKEAEKQTSQITAKEL